ncbi:hypothetical protein [Tautonia plasticadhaerens]|nr:hypothetical protein [Tautonia plasticadhaerens]
MGELWMPSWFGNACHYISVIRDEVPERVHVYAADEDTEIRYDPPERPCLVLESRSRRSSRVRVQGPGGSEDGAIAPEGFLPGVRYVMRRDSGPVWTLSVRSLLRKRHALELAGGEAWVFDTPFFWKLRVTGTVRGSPDLLGCVGPTMRCWLFAIEPSRDSPDLLAAIAYLHQRWWHS